MGTLVAARIERPSASQPRIVGVGLLALLFILAIGARLVGITLFITPDEDNWMRRTGNFAEALEFIDAIPLRDEGRLIHAARCALELALLDLSGRAFGRSAADLAGWMGLPGFGPPGAAESVRYSGIVLGKSERSIRLFLRLQQLYGLRDFKLKVATAGWEERARWAAAALTGAIARREAKWR